jgi:hypothetical protein
VRALGAVDAHIAVLDSARRTAAVKRDRVAVVAPFTVVEDGVAALRIGHGKVQLDLPIVVWSNQIWEFPRQRAPLGGGNRRGACLARVEPTDVDVDVGLIIVEADNWDGNAFENRGCAAPLGVQG